jgi:sugar (pentulose or hexulose) kinase
MPTVGEPLILSPIHGIATRKWLVVTVLGIASDYGIDSIQALGIPLEILPAIHPPGDIIGTVQCTAFNLPLDTPVCIPMGDHPCSVLAALYPPMDKRVNRTTTGALCSCTRKFLFFSASITKSHRIRNVVCRSHQLWYFSSISHGINSSRSSLSNFQSYK